MSAAVTLLATAAATVGAVSALRTIQRRMAEGERRLEAVRRKQAAKRDAEMIDLEADAVTGVYAMRREGALPDGAPPGEPG